MAEIANYSHGAPSTQYYLYADLIGQNQAGNYSTIRVTVAAYNRGSTGSYSSYWGECYGYINGYGGSAYYSAQPFLPSGYGNGAQRFSVSADINVGHDANGNIGTLTLYMRINSADSSIGDHTVGGTFGGIPRIPKRPSSPGTPTFSNVMPQSVDVAWGGSGDNGGSGIDYYLLRRWDNAAATGGYTDAVVYGLSRSVTGLTPGQEYSFGVYAHNGSADNGGYSNVSGISVVRMLSGARVKLGGVWRLAIPYVKVAGVWKLAMPFTKVSGIWKRTG